MPNNTLIKPKTPLSLVEILLLISSVFLLLATPIFCGIYGKKERKISNLIEQYQQQIKEEKVLRESLHVKIDKRINLVKLRETLENAHSSLKEVPINRVEFLSEESPSSLATMP